MELIKPDFTLLVMVVIFLITYFILKKFLVEPINGVLEWRAEQVHEADAKYEDAMATLHESSADAETQLREARRDAADVRDRYRTEATSSRDEKMSVARAEAEQVISEADEKLSSEVEEVRTNLDRDAEALAREMAARVLGRELDR